MALPTPNGTEALDAEGSEGVRETQTTTTTGEPTMNLTVFDERQGCYILNPAAFPNIINAFHPDYVKTYHPDLCKDFRINKAPQAEKVMTEHVTAPAHVNRPRAGLKAKLAPTEFHVYQKAGMPKGVK